MKSFYLVILLMVFAFTQVNAAVERRAAIDIGSGGTKVAIADIDTETNQIVQIILDTSFPVPYQASLDKSADGTFDEETKELGLKTFKEIKEIADQYQVQKIVAIATSAFRKANNSRGFVSEIEKQTKICIQIIPQREEGEIAFFSALASVEFNPEEAVVWDIGTGSLQITTANISEGLTVYMGEQMGSVAFKNYIVDAIQENEIEDTISPNPMSEGDLKAADSYARAFARKAYPIIKQKIQGQGTVIGIGRLFYHSIRPLASEGDVITRRGLRNFIENSLNKTDEELNNPFAHVDVSNCILTLAIMKALHIQEIRPIETTTTRGLLVSPSYWMEEK
ncbi:putative exopolyphosphatase [Chlamydiales bacterium STE3]|nr:putative exopolyphosphatase [Chlamydiales bacterium STE3]